MKSLMWTIAGVILIIVAVVFVLNVAFGISLF